MDNLKFFSKAITFVGELNNVYSEKYRNVRLYYKLMKKTPIGNESAIKKHVTLLLEYINRNTDAIKEKNSDKLDNTNIIMDYQIYLNLTECIKGSDKDTQNIIFSHLLLLLYISNPNEDVKELLQTKQQEHETETNFIDGFVNKIEKQFADKDFKDPISAAMSMMQSGIFSEIVQDMNDKVTSGNLNPQKLLGSVQGMLGNLTGGKFDINSMFNGQNPTLSVPGNPGEPNHNIDMNQMFNMVSGMMGGGGGTSQPDMSNPMGMMSSILPMLGGGGGPPSIDELEAEMNKNSLEDKSL